jgi:hypothetical protein
VQEEEEGVGTASWRSGKYTVKKLDDFPNIFLQCNFIFSQLEFKQNFYENLYNQLTKYAALGFWKIYLFALQKVSKNFLFL